MDEKDKAERQASEKFKKRKFIFNAIDYVVSLIFIVAAGIFSCYDFQIRMIGKRYTDFQVNYSSERLDITNAIFDIENFDYLGNYGTSVYSIMNNTANTHKTVVYGNNYVYFQQVLEKLDDDIEQEKEELMLNTTKDLLGGKISIDNLNNAIMDADLKIKELTDNYEKTKEELNGLLAKMGNRMVIVKTADYAYEVKNEYLTGDKWLGNGGGRVISGEAVISLFYDNDVSHSGEKWDENGKIILSRTVYQCGIEFKGGDSALIYYSDGSIGNSMFVLDNIDELHNHPIGETEIKWHDEYGSYSATIYFDDLLSKLGDLS